MARKLSSASEIKEMANKYLKNGKYQPLNSERIALTRKVSIVNKQHEENNKSYWEKVFPKKCLFAH